MCYPPITELCSGEVLGYKFIVPCKAKEILSVHYGNESLWSTPQIKDYKLASADWENGETRSEFEIPYMWRYFLKDGNIDVRLTLFNINIRYFEATGKRLTSLPIDDDNFL
jgi:hypothetical protein